MIFTTPEGRTYTVSDDLIADGGMSAVAAMVQLDRDGITDEFVVAEADSPMSAEAPDAPPRWT